MFMKLCAGGFVTAYTLTWIYTRTLRKATGWVDPDSKEARQMKIDKFLENNKDAEVIELKTGENYF